MHQTPIPVTVSLGVAPANAAPRAQIDVQGLALGDVDTFIDALLALGPEISAATGETSPATVADVDGPGSDRQVLPSEWPPLATGLALDRNRARADLVNVEIGPRAERAAPEPKLDLSLARTTRQLGLPGAYDANGGRAEFERAATQTMRGGPRSQL